MRPSAVQVVIRVTEQPFSGNYILRLSNTGGGVYVHCPCHFPASLTLILNNARNRLAPGEMTEATLTIGVNEQPSGVLTGALMIAAIPATTPGTPTRVQVYLPPVRNPEEAPDGSDCTRAIVTSYLAEPTVAH